MTELLRAFLSRHIVSNSIKIALVVGSVLNVINQSANLLNTDTISWLHMLLNYLVPYCVAGYSAAKNEVRAGNMNVEQSESH